jgi:predicted NBD/HSP70 family sugar kinase
MEDQLVHEIGAEHHRAAESGRPPILLDLNPAGAYVAGIHFGVRFIVGVLGDLRGRIIAQQVLPRARNSVPESNLQSAARLCQQLIESTPFDRSRLLGTGVAVVGAVDPLDGTVSYAPELDWTGVQVGRILERHLTLPVAVDSSSRAMTVAEALLGAARGARNVVVVHIGTVIGAGILLERRLFYGNSNRAGQLGHITVEPNGAACDCGNVGCLNAVAAEPAIVALARRLIADGHKTILSELMGDGEQLEPQMIYAAALRGDLVAQRVVATAARAVGRALTQACLMLDPELVVVTGEIQQVGSCFFQPLCETVESQRTRLLRRTPHIVPGSFGTESGAVGAVALGLARFFYRAGFNLEVGNAIGEASGS